MPEVKIVSHSASGAYEQCVVDLPWEDSPAPLRLILARNGAEYDYRLRDAGTIAYFFGGREPANQDAYGPLIQVRANPGFAGAILTSFPDLPIVELERIYRFCTAARDAAAASDNPEASSIALGLQQAASAPIVPF